MQCRALYNVYNCSKYTEKSLIDDAYKFCHLAYDQPTLDSASVNPYGQDRRASSSTKNRNAVSELNSAASVSRSKDLVHNINIPLGSNVQSGGHESVSKPGEAERGFNIRRLQDEKSRGESNKELQVREWRVQLEAVTQEKNELLQNQERVNAQWEGRVKRLERQLQAYQSGENPAEVGSVTNSIVL